MKPVKQISNLQVFGSESKSNVSVWGSILYHLTED